MIISTPKKMQTGLVGMENVGELIRFQHVEDVTAVLEYAQKQRLAVGSAHSHGREMEKIATIPGAVLVEHPEFAYDKKAFRKWLKSDEGRGYRTSTRDI